MSYSLRLTAPSASDKHWISTSYGGYNQCITCGGAKWCLPNCFSGDTEVITSLGIKKIRDLVGMEVDVPTREGWLPAVFDCFGRQKLWEVQLGKHTYRCTGDHRWPIFNKNDEFEEFVVTKDLKPGMRIHLTFQDEVEYEDCEEAVNRGLEYRPVFLLPSVYYSKTYIYNFLRGYFARYGTVDASGRMFEMRSENSDELQYIRDLFAVINMRTSKVVKSRDDTYYLRLYRPTLTENFFIDEVHRYRYNVIRNKKINRVTFVKQVKELDVSELVYCASQPETTTITLGGGELTGQCVGYAWGRFMEVMGTTTTSLSRGNAGTWYGYTSDGYKRGKTPALGAVICWSKPGAAGHVAIVEKINSDGSIVVSQSGYKNEVYNPSSKSHFWTGTITPKNGQYGVSWNSSAYVFQGFIYNPKGGSSAALSSSTSESSSVESDLLSEFLKVAESHIGEGGSWTWTTSGLAVNQPWCAAFVVACAKTVGILNIIIPNTFGAGNMARLSVVNNMGTWYKGPHQGGSFTPQPGDLIFFRWKQFTGVDEYYAQHVGIVKEVSGTIITTIEGNTSNRVGSNKFQLTSTSINGYIRPNWELVGASVLNLSYYTFSPLYSEQSTSEDAMVREIGYINKASKYEPSINSTDVKLSIINYTPALSAWYAVIAAVEAAKRGYVPGNTSYSDAISSINSSNAATVVADNLESNQRIIVQYLVGKGLNVAASVGILANIYAESRCKPSAYTIDTNGKPSGGICQWNASRYTAMVNYVGSNWKTNLSGQLDYLWSELTGGNFTTYVRKYFDVSQNLLEYINTVKVNESGARQAADIFVKVFERPANVSKESENRQSYASNFWSQIAIQMV